MRFHVNRQDETANEPTAERMRHIEAKTIGKRRWYVGPRVRTASYGRA